VKLELAARLPDPVPNFRSAYLSNSPRGPRARRSTFAAVQFLPELAFFSGGPPSACRGLEHSDARGRLAADFSTDALMSLLLGDGRPDPAHHHDDGIRTSSGASGRIQKWCFLSASLLLFRIARPRAGGRGRRAAGVGSWGREVTSAGRPGGGSFQMSRGRTPSARRSSAGWPLGGRAAPARPPGRPAWRRAPGVAAAPPSGLRPWCCSARPAGGTAGPVKPPARDRHGAAGASPDPRPAPPPAEPPSRIGGAAGLLTRRAMPR